MLDNSTGTASYIGNLAELRITGELGVDQPTLVRNITGPLVFETSPRSITTNVFFSGSIEADSMGGLVVGNASSTSLGNLTIHGNHAGSITVPSFCSGDYLIEGNYTGFASFGGGGSNRTFTGTFTVGTDTADNLTGRIQMANLTAPNGRIVVFGDADNTSEPPIRITNSITGTGATAPLISIGDQLNGTIAIDGALANASSTAEIAVTNATLGALGAIAINYDGPSSAGDDWASGASVMIGTTPYTGTDRGAHVWSVSRCKGDMNGDRAVSAADQAESFDEEDNAPFDDALIPDFVEYRGDYPGLEGSRVWHGDCNFSGGFNSNDSIAFDILVADACCLSSDPGLFPGDVVGDGCNLDYVVDITDLAALLSGFGTATGATRCQGDLDSDADVDINDLAFLLANFGNVWDPCVEFSPPPTGTVTISIAGWDTGGYSGGSPAFSGEKHHFVFDALVTINTGADDWIGSGATVARANGATFRLVPSPGNPPVPGSSMPEKYATFFSVPYAVDANSRFNSPFPTGGIAGGYSPTSASYTYTTTAVNAAWYDTNTSSNDGPATVFRLVIDVSGVSGANPTGFGGVYFTTGAGGSGDIKVADMTFEVEHKYDDSGSIVTTGSFYVTD